MVKLLLEEDTKRNEHKDLYGKALISAISQARGDHLAVSKLLIDYGAEVNFTSMNGGPFRHPLDAAAYQGSEPIIHLYWIKEPRLIQTTGVMETLCVLRWPPSLRRQLYYC
jgi:hypothetical protein